MSGTTSPNEVSFYDLLTPIVRHWKLMILVPVALAAAAGAVSFLVRPSFTAVTSFIPATSGSVSLPSGLGGLAGLAGQLGISTGGGGNVTPEFFASVLKSRELLKATLLSEFEEPGRIDSRKTLLDLMGVPGNQLEQQMDVGIKRLRNLISTAVDART